MGNAGTAVAAFFFGGAVGLLNNAISGLTWRLGGRDAASGSGTSANWPALFSLHYVLRIALSVASLYVTYRVSAANPTAVLANLAGLFLARYLLLWRLSRGGAGSVW